MNIMGFAFIDQMIDLELGFVPSFSNDLTLGLSPPAIAWRQLELHWISLTKAGAVIAMTIPEVSRRPRTGRGRHAAKKGTQNYVTVQAEFLASNFSGIAVRGALKGRGSVHTRPSF